MHAGVVSRARWITTALGAAAVALLAAGCTGPQELPAQGAAAHYDQLREDVIAAVGAEDLGLEMHAEPFVTTEEGACVFDPGSWEAYGELFTGDEAS